MLEFSTEAEVRSSIVIGTVREMVGEGGTIELNARNFVGSSRLIVTLVKANGGRAKVVCSPTVSKLFRKKEITLGELMSLNIHEEESVKGEPINVIEMPTSNDAPIAFAVDEIEEATFVSQPLKFVPEERIAM